MERTRRFGRACIDEPRPYLLLPREEPAMTRPSKPKKPSRNGSVTIRISREQRALIDRAEARGKSPLASRPETTPSTAEVIPLDQALPQVDAPTYARLVEILEGPPQINDRLRKLIRTKAPPE
jgi:uncharacterized protein (DUF1778 family)